MNIADGEKFMLKVLLCYVVILGMMATVEVLINAIR